MVRSVLRIARRMPLGTRLRCVRPSATSRMAHGKRPKCATGRQYAKAAQDVHPVRPAGLTKREEETHQNVDYAGFTYAGDQHGKRTFGGQDPYELSRADEKERDKNRPKGKRCLSRA